MIFSRIKLGLTWKPDPPIPVRPESNCHLTKRRDYQKSVQVMFSSASTVKLISVAWGLIPVQVPTKADGTGESLWVSGVAWPDLFDSVVALLLVPD